jgi:UDP-N-acetylmuramyl pentapeptide phosphotransferase/UDP-N-acetylglucosamine-1-phosphate transferase
LLQAALLGFALGSVFLHLLRPVLGSPYLERLNYRGHRLATAGGLVGVVATLFGVGVWWFLHADATGPVVAADVLAAVLIVTVGFGLLGFVDDVLAAGSDRGFTGHLRALSHGRLTTGGLKLLGGGVVGVLAALLLDDGQQVRVVADAVLIALAANAGNLFDRAPGRTLKVGTLAAVALVLTTSHDELLVGPAIAVAAFVALLRSDLRESLMLGDTGANVLGGVLGLSLLVAVEFRTRMVVLLVLLALNAASELVSFSKVIDRVAPLRWVDRAGRRPRYPDLP